MDPENKKSTLEEFEETIKRKQIQRESLDRYFNEGTPRLVFTIFPR